MPRGLCSYRYLLVSPIHLPEFSGAPAGNATRDIQQGWRRSLVCKRFLSPAPPDSLEARSSMPCSRKAGRLLVGTIFPPDRNASLTSRGKIETSNQSAETISTLTRSLE